MPSLEQYAAENARLKALLEKQGFRISYTKQGLIKGIAKPRKPLVKHTARYWAKKKGYKNNISAIRRITKDKAISERTFKNAADRAELIKNGAKFLKENGNKIPQKFFDKIPTYVLKDNTFYSTVGQYIQYLGSDENTNEDFTDKQLKEVLNLSVKRIKNFNKEIKSKKRKPLKPFTKPSTNAIIKAAIKK